MFSLAALGFAPAAIIAVLSAARTVRLVVFDDFPPMVWLRVRLLALFGEKWGKVWTCPFCLAPYIMAGIVGWGYLSDLHWTWWVINGVWGLSYVASILVAYDQPEE